MAITWLHDVGREGEIKYLDTDLILLFGLRWVGGVRALCLGWGIYTGLADISWVYVDSNILIIVSLKAQAE